VSNANTLSLLRLLGLTCSTRFNLLTVADSLLRGGSGISLALTLSSRALLLGELQLTLRLSSSSKALHLRRCAAFKLSVGGCASALSLGKGLAGPLGLHLGGDLALSLGLSSRRLLALLSLLITLALSLGLAGGLGLSSLDAGSLRLGSRLGFGAGAGGGGLAVSGSELL
jgi:hypothetical protein